MSLSLLPARVQARLRRLGRNATVAIAGTTMIAVGGLAFASHGDTVIDLASSPGLDEEHNGAIFIQGGTGAGTGTFDPFLTANPGGGADTESAINVCQDDPSCPDAQFDTHLGGDRTHHLNLAAVPEIEIEGTLYREFSLDANDQGGDDFMSIDVIEIYLDTQKDAGDFDPVSGTFGIDTAPAATLEWELDIPILMRSQTFTPGSGVSDITVFVPSTEFDTEEDCSYGSQDCEHFLYFYFEAGDFDGVLAGFEGADWNVTSGFEEWRTRLLPVVDVNKDATPTFDREFDWTVTKTVSVDGGAYVDAESVDLFVGDDVIVDWKIEIDKGEPIDDGHSVTGSITVFNPTGGDLIETSIDAVINDVTDVIDGGVGPVTPDCGVTFPHTLGAQETLTCTYSAALPDGTTRTNTATANINDDLEGTKDYIGTAEIDFAGVEPTVTDDTADLTDAQLPAVDATFDADATVTQGETLDCDDAGDNVNTAVITEADSGDTESDAATVTITCHELTVTKDATPTFGRTFDWTVTKTVSVDGGSTYVDAADVDLFSGDDVVVDWKIEIDKSDPIDSGHAVTGTITITNPAPMPAEDVAVTDSLTGGIAATVDCDPGTEGNQATVTVPAAGLEAGSATCTYSAALPDGTTRTNTASASLFGEDYTGTAPVNFAGVTPTVTDDTADLTDARLPVVDANFGADATVTQQETLDCDDAGDNVNTAVITEADSGDIDSDDATVTVTCHGLTVTKDATPSFDRDWTWTIDKNADATDITINEDESATINYEVDVSATHVDSGYAVSGTITITNPAPIAATNVAVTDELTGGIAATVDCDPLTAGDQASVTVPANDSATCSYSALLPDASTRTNTATATLEGEDYIGTAEVNFTDVIPTETDETIDVTDTFEGLLGQVTATPPDPFEHTFSYQRIVPGSSLLCGENLIENTATFVTTDTAATGSADEDVTITVICLAGQGCTPGFWQGGAGFDLWDVPNDDDFPPPGENGIFAHDLLFNDFFAPHGSLDGLTMLELVGTGGGNDPVRRAARSLVAAYLNALADGVAYDYTTGELEALWAAAVADGKPNAFKTLNDDLDEKNNLGADLCGFPEEETLEASALGVASIALAVWLMLSAAWRGRHVRRPTLLND